MFQIHWGAIPTDEAAGLVPAGIRLLAMWPAPVNPDICFETAGFTLFGDNDEDWDRAAEELLQCIIERLRRFGAVKLLSRPLCESPPWYLRPFRVERELTLHQQALFPMQHDSLPTFHAMFGDNGVSLRTGQGHFLLWIGLPDDTPDTSEFVRDVAGPWPMLETQLQWHVLLPNEGK